jgi:hypothetical protein
LAEPHLEAAARGVGAMAERVGLAERLEPYASLRWGVEPFVAPMLHLDDFSELPFLDGVSGVQEYQHRARTRAGTGDIFAAATPAVEGYEEYCRDHLGLGEPELLEVEPVAGPLAIAAACLEPRPFERLLSLLREAGGMAIQPFMGIEAIWKLAKRLSEESGLPVRVLAPPPPVTWIANDKVSFSEVVTRTLGEEWLVEGASSAEPSRLAADLVSLAERHEEVALKRLRCVSGMGNAIFSAAELRRRGREWARSEVDAFLERTEWEGDEEVLTVAWEPASSSPSTQIFIPPAGSGPPLLDGIYEQLLIGEEKVFAGSVPSRLGARVHQRLGPAAIRIGAALQALGYVGRCSFDHLLIGDPNGEFELRFVECNGRWGGTSTPMNLLDRLVEGERPPYKARDFVDMRLVPVPFTEILEMLGPTLYDPRTREGSYLLYNVGPLRTVGKIDVIALGDSPAAAERALESELPRLLGLD